MVPILASHPLLLDYAWRARAGITLTGTLCLCYSVPGTSFGEQMDSMSGQHGNGETRDSQAAVLSVLLSSLASKRVVLDRQQGRNRLGTSLGSPMNSAK